MKKYLGALLSLLTGGLTFVWMSIAHMATDYLSINGWDMIQIENASQIDGMVLYQIGAIAMIVMASLLIIMGVLLILKNAGIIKLNIKLNFINNILLAIYAVCAILAIVGGFILAGDGMSVGIGLWLATIIGIAACVAGFVLVKNEK